MSVEKLPRALIGDDTHTELSHYPFGEVVGVVSAHIAAFSEKVVIAV